MTKDIVRVLDRAKELKEKGIFKYYPSILVEGRAGIGKSQTVREWARKNGFKVRDIRLINYDVGDFVLKVPKDEALQNKYNEWLLELSRTEEPILLLLDEIDKAPETVQRMAYQLILDREVEGLKLSNNVMIVAIQNSDDDGLFNNIKREKPLWDRFVFRVEQDLDIDAFLEYAYKNFRNIELVAFLEKNKDFIYLEDKNRDLLIATPRRWEMLDKVLTGVEDINDIVFYATQVVGKEVALSLRAFLEIGKKYDVEKIIKEVDYSGVSKNDLFYILAIVAREVRPDLQLLEKHFNEIGKSYGKEMVILLYKFLSRRFADDEEMLKKIKLIPIVKRAIIDAI